MSKSQREPLGRNLQERTESVTGCDSNESSKSLKPKRASGTKLKMSASSPSVRIEVKFQRPLTWKVSSASSSSVQIPIKKSLQSKESVRSVNVALNGDHIGVVQPPPGNDQPFIFDIPIQSCNFKRKRQRRRPGKPKRHDDSIYSGSNSLKSESENSAQLKKQGIRQINSAKDPILRDKSSSEEPSRNSEPNFPFGKDRSHAVLSKFYPVMTCFPEPGLYVNNPGMGANGSAFPSGSASNQIPRSGGHRLKSRSQSSHALDCVKGSNNNELRHGDHSMDEYYVINAQYSTSAAQDGLSSSIPADMWDLPPNSQSYSPSRYRRKHGRGRGGHQEPDSAQPSRKNRFMQLPVLETLINLSRKGARNRGGRRTDETESEKISARAKLYAASCPDVTQHTNENGLDYAAVDMKRELDEENVRASQPVLYKAEPLHENFPAQRSRFCALHGQRRRQKSWTELERRRNSEEVVREQSAMSLDYPAFPFISEDAIFQVKLHRDHRGLGLGFSVSGGADSGEPFAGLIRVKKVFPMGPAFQSGQLKPWDIILKANGVSLIGLTNHEALEVLRTTPTETLLTVCRPPPLPELLSTTDMTFTETHPSNQSRPAFQSGNCPIHPRPVLVHRNSSETGSGISTERNRNRSLADSFSSVSSVPSFKSKSLSSLKIPSNPQVNRPHGEFEITLEKIGGSLGFTLKQDDSSILGHYVRELVKAPALGDGRIQPGDRILSVNSQELEGMSHTETVAFLRQCPTRVKLRLYRDISPTPISMLSPESHRVKDKTYRQEAIDMIHEMKERKATSASPDPKASSPGSLATSGLSRGYKQSQIDANGPSTLPKKRPVLVGMTPSPEVISAALDRFAGRIPPKTNQSPDLAKLKSKVIGPGTQSGNKGCPLENRSSGSGESTPVGTIIQKRKTEQKEESDGESICFESSVGNKSPVIGGRKPSFRQYTMHLDRISSLEDDSFSSELNHDASIVSAPGFGSSPNGKNFRAGQPAYQSAVFPVTSRGKITGRKNLSLSREEIEQFGQERGIGSCSRNQNESGPHTQLSEQKNQSSSNWSGSSIMTLPQQNWSNKEEGNDGSDMSSGLAKWKGVQFSQVEDTKDDREDEDDEDNLDSLDGSLPLRDAAVGASDGGPYPSSTTFLSSLTKKSSFLKVESGGKLSQRQSPDGREFHEGEMNMIEVSSSKDFNGEEIITVQLSRKWCSRLGFSIKGTNGHTYITAIYEDSVAGRDGRLHVGDEVIMVNNESIRNMETPEVIDMMRKTRGVITITLLRKSEERKDSFVESPSDLR